MRLIMGGLLGVALGVALAAAEVTLEDLEQQKSVVLQEQAELDSLSSAYWAQEVRAELDSSRALEAAKATVTTAARSEAGALDPLYVTLDLDLKALDDLAQREWAWVLRGLNVMPVGAELKRPYTIHRSDVTKVLEAYGRFTAQLSEDIARLEAER